MSLPGQATMLEEMAGATFSPCRTWRYQLWRRWGDGPLLMVVGLNPSTADETVNDPTIRRLIGFAGREGFDGLTMTNLFAYRATDPLVMRSAEDPVGPENDKWLERLARSHARVVVAWGALGEHHHRASSVLERGLLGRAVECFGQTKGGHPRHPLYLRGDTPLVPFATRGGA